MVTVCWQRDHATQQILKGQLPSALNKDEELFVLRHLAQPENSGSLPLALSLSWNSVELAK